MVRRFKALISSIDGLQNYEFGNKVTEFDKNYSNHQRVECFWMFLVSSGFPGPTKRLLSAYYK